MSSGIVFFLLFVVPFIILPFGITQFENPKVILAQFVILLLLLVQLFTNSLRLRLQPIYVFLYVSIFLLTIIDLLFLKTNSAFFGNLFRMQGTFLLWFLLLFSLLSSKISLNTISPIVYVVILGIEAILLFFLPINESGRYVGTLGEPNALAAFAIFVWPFFFFSVKKFGKKEIIYGIATSISVGIILFLSSSKSALIALIVQILFVILQKKNVSAKKAFIVCIVVYMVSYLLPFFQQTPYENRVQIWQSAIIAGTKNPLFGWGIGNMEIALHQSSQLLGLPVVDYYVDSTHNIFLDWWVAGGIVGLEIFVGFIILSFTSFLKTKQFRNSTLLLGMLTVLSFNPASIVGLLGLWWLIGQGADIKN